MEKNNKKRKRKTNLHDEIYFYTFPRPYHKDDLSLFTYGKKGHPTLIKNVQILEKKNWVGVYKFDELPEKFKEIVMNKDDLNRVGKRFYNRHFVLANRNIFLNRLIERLKVNGAELTTNEKEELESYINNPMSSLNVHIMGDLWRNYYSRDYFGEVNDIFQHMINIILIDCVHEKNINDCIEMTNRYLKKSYEHSNYDRIQTSEFILSNELANKLYRLDPYLSSHLDSFFRSYGRIYHRNRIYITKLAAGVPLKNL